MRERGLKMKPVLDWPAIHREVNAAVRASAKSRYISTKQLAKYILENQHLYPTVASTVKCTTARCTMSLNQQGWKLWSSERMGGNQKVFVIPEEVMKE